MNTKQLDPSTETINERVAKIDEAIQELKEINLASREEFFADKTLQCAALYALIMGIEAICDIGNHLLSYYFGRGVKTYKDIITSLAEVEVIPQEFAKKTEKMPDFRNLAIHVYLKIDENEIYKYIPLAIEQFAEYARHFLKFIEINNQK